MANPEMKVKGGQEPAINVTASESVVAQELQDLCDMVKTTLFELQSLSGEALPRWKNT